MLWSNALPVWQYKRQLEELTVFFWSEYLRWWQNRHDWRYEWNVPSMGITFHEGSSVSHHCSFSLPMLVAGFQTFMFLNNHKQKCFIMHREHMLGNTLHHSPDTPRESGPSSLAPCSHLSQPELLSAMINWLSPAWVIWASPQSPFEQLKENFKGVCY